MVNEELKFYPEHPSGEKTHQFETTAMPILTRDAPIDVKTLCNEFAVDALNITLTAEDIERIERAIPADKISGRGSRNFRFTNGKMSI